MMKVWNGTRIKAQCTNEKLLHFMWQWKNQQCCSMTGHDVLMWNGTFTKNRHCATDNASRSRWIWESTKYQESPLSAGKPSPDPGCAPPSKRCLCGKTDHEEVGNVAPLETKCACTPYSTHSGVCFDLLLAKGWNSVPSKSCELLVNYVQRLILMHY